MPAWILLHEGVVLPLPRLGLVSPLLLRPEASLWLWQNATEHTTHRTGTACRARRRDGPEHHCDLEQDPEIGGDFLFTALGVDPHPGEEPKDAHKECLTTEDQEVQDCHGHPHRASVFWVLLHFIILPAKDARQDAKIDRLSQLWG